MNTLPMCSGFGQFHTNEADQAKPNKKLTPYEPITLDEVIELVSDPAKVDKSQGRWLIPSTLLSRTFKEQEVNGNYLLLWADLDKQPPGMDDLSAIVVRVVGAGTQFLLYNSRSATPDNQKARLLIPLAAPLSGADWLICQTILNDGLEGLKVVPDRVSEGAAQLCYLPNRGELYDYRIKGTKPFSPHTAWPDRIQKKRDALRLEEEASRQRQEQARIKRKQRQFDSKDSPINAFNLAYTVEEVLTGYGYDQRGNNFRHPASESGSYSASVKDGRVYSLSQNDPLYTANDSNGAHDAFSAFCVLNHGGDQSKAVRAAAELLGMNRPSSGSGGNNTHNNDGLINEAIGKLKDDPGAIFEPDILKLLREARKTDPAAWARYKAAIKATNKASMSDLDKQTKPTGADDVPEMFAEVVPWEQPVDGGVLLDDIAGAIRRHLVADEPTIRAASLWIAFTWFIDVVSVAPIANITAPEKRCGKTVLLSLMGKLCCRPMTTSNMSSAPMFRSIERWHPTLLIDEVDSFLNENEDARGILNSGFTRDAAFVIRCVGDDHMPTRFDTWGAKALCGIGKLSDTLQDRSIPLRLRRKLPGERVANLRHTDPQLFNELMRKLARWTDDHKAIVSKARPATIAGLHDRANDCWEPLLAIADAAGGNWSSHARTDALILHGAEEDVQSIGVELLQDIHAIFEGKGVKRMFTVELLNALIEDEEKPWATWNRVKPMTARQMAKKLEGFNIRPKKLRIGNIESPKRGYEADDFADAYKRYKTTPDPHSSADPPNSSGTTEQTSSSRGFGDFSHGTDESMFHQAKPPEPLLHQGCSVVPDRNTPPGRTGADVPDVEYF